jgi:succinyl-diaminopimelate desuccinylase
MRTGAGRGRVPRPPREMALQSYLSVASLRTARALAPLRHRDCRLLVAGQVTSNAATPATRSPCRSLLAVPRIDGHDGGMGTDQILATAADLLAVPSTADRPADLQRALDFVIGFTGSGFTVERFESGGKPSALIYYGPSRRHFRVVLNAHLDVVPAPAEQFRPRVVGDRIYARGAQDMKISAIVQALAFRELAASLPYHLALQLVTDEEVGGNDGTLHQIRQGVAGEFVVIGEYSGLNVVTQSKGLVVAALQAEGTVAHSAYPWLGDNALLKLHHSLARILNAYPTPAREAWQTTVNLARIETDNRAYNQIPARAAALLDVRFPPGDADFSGRTRQEIAAYLAGFCEPGVTAVVQHVSPPQEARADRPEIRRLQDAAERQGYRSGLLRRHGASDARFYTELGVDAVSFGVDGGGQHGDEEYALIPSIPAYYQALRDFLSSPE